MSSTDKNTGICFTEAEPGPTTDHAGKDITPNKGSIRPKPNLIIKVNDLKLECQGREGILTFSRDLLNYCDISGQGT